MNTPRTQDEMDKVLAGIIAPVKGGILSSLGGANRTSALLSISIDAKENWPKGNYLYSRYIGLSWGSDNILELFAQSHRFGKRFRKTLARDAGEAIAKINKFLDKVRESL